MKTVKDIIGEYNGEEGEKMIVHYLTMTAMLKDAQISALRKAVEIVKGYEHLHAVASSLEQLIEEVKVN